MHVRPSDASQSQPLPHCRFPVLHWSSETRTIKNKGRNQKSAPKTRTVTNSSKASNQTKVSRKLLNQASTTSTELDTDAQSQFPNNSAAPIMQLPDELLSKLSLYCCEDASNKFGDASKYFEVVPKYFEYSENTSCLSAFQQHCSANSKVMVQYIHQAFLMGLLGKNRLYSLLAAQEIQERPHQHLYQGF
ncbi:hypothetical protein FRC02_007350 [Tulasnella sp. 418]|nr:hypothetical protein FRC02_007350 [Tulasnella sp. 418]